MSLLNTGSSALLAFQRALDTVGHNVANANTAGYSRQRVELVDQPGQVHGYGFTGSGVRVETIVRGADAFGFERRLDSAGELGRLDVLATLSARVDKTFSDAASGLPKPWNDYASAVQGVASEPVSTAARHALIAAGEALGARFRSLQGSLDAMSRETGGRIGALVGKANGLLADVAKLNLEISRQQALSGGQPPNDLLDERDRKVAGLGTLLGVRSVLQDDGMMNLFLPGGQALVVGRMSLTLRTTQDAFRAERLNVEIVGAGASLPVASSTAGGELRGLMEFREDVLDPLSASLGRITAGFVQGANEIHRAGTDLAGAAGGDLFAALNPSARAARDNAGNGTFTASIDDVSQMSGEPLLLTLAAGNWQAVSSRTGLPVALSGSGTVADPLRAGGIALIAGGAAANGDRFLVDPAAGLATQARLLVNDPARIAAASAHVFYAAGNNAGNAAFASLDVDDASAAGFRNGAAIVFTSATAYTLDGNGPFAFDPATGIAGAGWTLRLAGSPAAGDRFNLAPRGAGGSDNANARALGGLGAQQRLDNGSGSLDDALAQMTVQGGIAARRHADAHAAQTVVDERFAAERESQAGVNLDEEAASLMKYQQSYQAAARMIATADTIFQSLLAAVRT